MTEKTTTKKGEVKASFKQYASDIERSVNYLANRICRKSPIEFEDAKQEMLVSAWKAYQSYDPAISKFVTYAVHRMKQRAITLLSLSNKKERPLHIDDEIEQQLADEKENVETEVVNKLYGEESVFEAKEKLDEIETLLCRAAEIVKSQSYIQSYELFKLLRYGSKITETVSSKLAGKKVRFHKYAPLTLTDACGKMKKNRGWMSRLLNEKIRILATDEGKASIVRQIERAAEKQTSKRTERSGGEEMATTKKSAKKVAKKGRTPRKGGLHEKIAWVSANFCEKNKTRPEAVQGLLGKYDGMSENYARTIVYSQMKEYDFEAARRKKSAKKGSKTLAKKGSSVKAKKHPAKKTRNEEDDDEYADL